MVSPKKIVWALSATEVPTIDRARTRTHASVAAIVQTAFIGIPHDLKHMARLQNPDYKTFLCESDFWLLCRIFRSQIYGEKWKCRTIKVDQQCPEKWPEQEKLNGRSFNPINPECEGATSTGSLHLAIVFYESREYVTSNQFLHFIK